MGSGVFYSIKMWPMDGQCRKKTIQSSALFPGFASTQPFKPQKKDQMLQWKNDKDKSEHLI